MPQPIRVRTREENLEIGQRVVERFAEMTPEEVLELTVRAGIHTPDGRLTPEYRDDET